MAMAELGKVLASCLNPVENFILGSSRVTDRGMQPFQMGLH